MTSATYNTAVTNSFGLIKIVVYELQVLDQYLKCYLTWPQQFGSVNCGWTHYETRLIGIEILPQDQNG